MKKKYVTFFGILFVITLLFSSSLLSSVPQKMHYQAVVRGGNDELVRDQRVGMQISILHYTNDGTPVYVETQTPQTNTNGLVSIEIGAGDVVSGDFSLIDWADGPYFIKTEIDILGTSYHVVSVQQLLSVPYASYAHKSERIIDGTTLGEMLYWNGTDWVMVPPPDGDDHVLVFYNGVPMWIMFRDAILFPPPPSLALNEVYNPITRKIWLNTNLGTTWIAVLSTDDTSYGDLYQWGRGTDGHEKRTSGTAGGQSSSDSTGHGYFIVGFGDWRSPSNDNLWQGINGVNNPCPSGFRIPTAAEWDAERLSWGSNNSSGAFASPLKLTVAGIRNNINGVISAGTAGYYWSSTIDGMYARNLGFNNTNANITNDYRAKGCSVRCIKD